MDLLCKSSARVFLSPSPYPATFKIERERKRRLKKNETSKYRLTKSMEDFYKVF